MNQETHNASQDLARLWQTPALKLGAILAMLASFCWGMYFEINRQIAVFPLGTIHMRNYLGFLAYTLSALIALSFSGAVLYRGFKDSAWQTIDIYVFYGGILLGLVLLMSGFEFILFGEWKYENPYPYMILKGITVFVFSAFLLFIWLQERKDTQRDQAEESAGS